MHRLRKLTGAALLGAGLCFAGTAHAGLLVMPHMLEYSKTIPGMYGLLEFGTTNVKSYYERDGQSAPVSQGSVDINAVIAGAVWIDNWFRDTSVPFLNTRTQSCGFALSAAHIQGRGSVVGTANILGLNAGTNQTGDLYLLCGIQDKTHRFGPIKGHLQPTLIVKAPLGGYETDNLYNWGTNYWMYAPQLSVHAEWGRFSLESTAVYQFNGHNSEPGSGGLDPTTPANWHNEAFDLGFKLTDRWWFDVGYSLNRSVGSNEFAKVNLSNPKPIPPAAACDPFQIPAAICNVNTSYYIQSRPGPYYDRGVRSDIAMASVYYAYRSSLLVNLRAAKIVRGRGSEIDPVFDVCTSQPCGPSNAIQQTSLRAQGVGEAAASPSAPFFEVRFVFPMGSP